MADTLKCVHENGWRVDSIQVVRHGKLVLDSYFYPYSPGHPHDLRSVTKSVTSSLLGLSIAQGKWSGVDVPVLSQFPTKPIAAVDDRKQAMTLGNLVDMRSGMAWTEYPYNEKSSFYLMEQSKDWIGFILNQPMVAAPGSRFNYSGANMNLLAAMIGKAWSMPAREVARTQLFEPIGITRHYWNGVDPDGNTIGQSTLYLLPIDMARLGLLWLHDGVWQDRRILPAGWTGKVLATALPAEDDGDFYKRGFWVNQERTRYAALGRHGQAILVDPAQDMVIVITGKSADNEETHLSQVAEMIRHGIGAAPSLPSDPAAQAALEAMVRQVVQPPMKKLGLVGLGTSQYGKTWQLGRNQLGIATLRLSADTGDTGAMILELGKKSSKVVQYPCGLDGCFRFSSNEETHNQALALKGRWVSPTLLEMECQYPDSGDSTYMVIRLEFKVDDLSISFADNQYFSGTIHSLAKKDRFHPESAKIPEG
jgi:CubicO group peptidase (beta-lactamase class C family)